MPFQQMPFPGLGPLQMHPGHGGPRSPLQVGAQGLLLGAPPALACMLQVRCQSWCTWVLVCS